MAEVTEALRRQIREELPEVEAIRDPGLRDKVVEAWALAIARSSFASISDIHPSTSLRKLFAPRSIVTAGRTHGSQVINTDRLRRSFSLGSFACAI